MLNFKIFVLNGLAGPYRKFLGMAVKKFGNFTQPSMEALSVFVRACLLIETHMVYSSVAHFAMQWEMEIPKEMAVCCEKGNVT